MYSDYWYSISSPLCLLQNEAMKQTKRYQLLDNLGGYQKFSSSEEYIEKIFPLLQNEYNCSIRREMRRYLYALQEQEQYPLVYRVILDDEHRISKEDGIRLDILKDYFDFMPALNKKIDERKLWKYKHYAQYLLFKQQSQYLGAVFTQKEDGLIFSSLAIFKKSKEEKFLLLPYSYDSIEMLNIKNIRIKQNKLIEYRNKIIDGAHQKRQTYSLQPIWDQSLDVYFQPFCSISSYLNEKETLFQISSCPFVDLILEPLDSLNYVDKTMFAEQVEKQKMKYFSNPNFRKHFDEDQLCAINDAVKFNKKITIIKGPPGTGKTQTILGICSIMQELLQPEFSDGKKNGVILILAKSNSVVNDLVRKIMRNSEEKNEIIFCEKNKPKNIQIVRFGRPELCDPDIYSKSLEIRTQNKFFNKLFLTKKEEMFSKHITPEIIQKLKTKNLETFGEFQKRNQSQYFTLFALLNYIEHINIDTKNPQILNAYGNLYDSLSQFLQNNQKQYIEIEQNFLIQCNVIVSTLNSCSKKCLEDYFSKVKFRMCIVDEAPTALEPSLLIPFVKYKNMEKIVLLGDRRQLDPIVVSKDSKNYGYNKSLFERLSSQLKKNSFKLKHQYRQMENLAEITSVMFYNNSLVNGITNMQFPPYIKEKVIRNRLFFNTPQNTEEKEETSKKNDCECLAIILLVNYLLSGIEKQIINEKKITVISAYAAQRENIRAMLEKQKLDKIVELDTVDSFQGKENDIIILSLVRSNQETGFLADKKRTNVALSRAKYCQYIFGTKQTLNRNFKNWNKVIKMLQQEREIIDYQESDLQNPNFFRDQLMPKQK